MEEFWWKISGSRLALWQDFAGIFDIGGTKHAAWCPKEIINILNKGGKVYHKKISDKDSIPFPRPKLEYFYLIHKDGRITTKYTKREIVPNNGYYSLNTPDKKFKISEKKFEKLLDNLF